MVDGCKIRVCHSVCVCHIKRVGERGKKWRFEAPAKRICLAAVSFCRVKDYGRITTNEQDDQHTHTHPTCTHITLLLYCVCICDLESQRNFIAQLQSVTRSCGIQSSWCLFSHSLPGDRHKKHKSLYYTT